MNGGDPELFEAELRKLTPAKPPAEFMAGLAAARPAPAPLHPQPSTLNFPCCPCFAGWGWPLPGLPSRRLCWCGGPLRQRTVSRTARLALPPKPRSKRMKSRLTNS